MTWLLAHQPILAALALAASLATNTGQALITWIHVGKTVSAVIEKPTVAPTEDAIPAQSDQ